jgi:outer membrane protein OmpA-like peptidoglycan-associated protein
MRKGRYVMRTLVFGFVLLTGSLSVHAQVALGRCGEEGKDPSKTEQSALKALNKGDLPMAKVYLQTAVRKEGGSVHTLYLMGELAMKQEQPLQALASWEKLLSECPQYLPEVWYYVGALRVLKGDSVGGLQAVQTYLKDPEREGSLDREAKNLVADLTLAAQLKAHPVAFVPVPVPGINTPADEYLSIVSPDGSLAYFTRRTQAVDRKSGPAPVKRTLETFMESTWQDDVQQFSMGQALESPFNRGLNEGGPSVTANNRELYLTVCENTATGYRNCDVFWSKKNGDHWGALMPVPGGVNQPNSWESQPSVSANGDWLYFVSNRPGGTGGLDLYRSQRLPDGSWSKAEALPKEINTALEEKSPYLHPDGVTLYFASSGHPGVGGLDLYMARYQPDKKSWTTPKNVGIPINTPEDEVGLFVDLAGARGYFSTNTRQGPGGWDLYQFTLPEGVRPQSVALVKGAVSTNDANPRGLEGAEVQLTRLHSKEMQRIEVDQENGRYAHVVALAPGERVMVQVVQEGAAFNGQVISEENTKESPVVQAELEARVLQKSTEYAMNSIQFASNSAALNADALALIEGFATYLHSRPDLRVEVQGHTDDVGDDVRNLELSSQRAQAVKVALQTAGIAASRLQAKGYGEKKPLVPNTTEAARQRNRRTVFVVL